MVLMGLGKGCKVSSMRCEAGFKGQSLLFSKWIELLQNRSHCPAPHSADPDLSSNRFFLSLPFSAGTSVLLYLSPGCWATWQLLSSPPTQQFSVYSSFGSRTLLYPYFYDFFLRSVFDVGSGKKSGADDHSFIC